MSLLAIFAISCIGLTLCPNSEAFDVNEYEKEVLKDAKKMFSFHKNRNEEEVPWQRYSELERLLEKLMENYPNPEQPDGLGVYSAIKMKKQDIYLLEYKMKQGHASGRSHYCHVLVYTKKGAERIIAKPYCPSKPYNIDYDSKEDSGTTDEIALWPWG